MPRGDKSAYSARQKRQAGHIEESVREHGDSEADAERIGWATVNKQDGGALGGLLWGTGRRQGMVEAMAKQAARTVGSGVGRQILRGVLGGILGGSRR